LRTEEITGTAILSALVVVFDYTLKFAGIKIPFPLFPVLKFDLDGIPIVLSLLLYGPYSALVTCFVAFVAILARSGAVVSASMKAIAEFGTVLGMVPFYRIHSSRFKGLAIVSGISARVLVMVFANLAAWPLVFQSVEAAIAFIPFLAVFNAIAGAISMSGGYLIHKALAKRAPTLLANSQRQNRYSRIRVQCWMPVRYVQTTAFWTPRRM